MSSIGEIITLLDIGSGMELWKGYMVLTLNNSQILKSHINIEPVINFFCSEIIAVLGDIDKNVSFVNTLLK